MTQELDEKTRVAMLKMIASGILFIAGSIMFVSDIDVALNTIGFLAYISSVGLFLATEGKRRALKNYRKFIKQ